MTPIAGTDLIVADRASLASDVRHFLMQTPRQLPSRALYDTLGSALFDAICELPWYPVTRAERRLIAGYRGEIFETAGLPDRLVELGCGNGDKLSLLLGPAEEFDALGVRRIDLVDVSKSALVLASRQVAEGRKVTIVTHQQRYEEGLISVEASRRAGERVCVMFLGSNIGNFDPPAADAFLAAIRATLQPDDVLLIGADLVKPERDLLLAYDDPLGVTAAFNKNLLVRVNRELGGTFDLKGFDHRAVWNSDASRVEMHLVSRGRQRVDITEAGLSIEFRPGEFIWTESSYKYEIKAFAATLRNAGFQPSRPWIDREGQFLLVLAQI
jgi:L-histidine Nalpha-methyltransferase